MNPHDLGLILHALSTPDAAFVLGAGASAPAVPTFAQLATKIAKNADRLLIFPASPIPSSALRDLMQPVLGRAQTTSQPVEWQAGAMTTATIAAILEQLISRAHCLSLPQYQVFSLFSLAATVVSFNWDGLAISRCPQQTVLHPHGIATPRVLTEFELDELLFDTQEIDEPTARHWFLPDLIFPGEETSPALEPIRKEVLSLWMKAGALLVVGYSFGLASHVAYDEVWLDVFAEWCSRNPKAPIHVFAPDAVVLRQALCERLKRNVDVFAWPVKWNALSSVLLETAATHAAPLMGLRVASDRMSTMARTISERSE